MLLDVIDEGLLQDFGRSSKGLHQRDWEGVYPPNAKESESEGDSVPERLDSDDKESLLVTIGMDRVNDSWYLDLDSSYLICLSRDWLDAYKFHSGISILMGENARLTSICIGMVCSDPSGCDVCFGFAKIFGFVGCLKTPRGCKCTTTDGVVKVVKGVLGIVKGDLVGNLYRLIGDAFPARAVNETSTNREETCLSGVRCDEIIGIRIDGVFEDII